MGSGFDVSGLVDFTNENQFELMRGTVLGAKMLKNNLATIVPNVKGPTKLPAIAQTIFFQTEACSFTASGGTAITQRTMTPGKVMVQDAWCPAELEPKYLVQQMKAGAQYDSVTPDEVWKAILDEYTEKIARDVDIAIWRGNTSSGTGNNQYWMGLINAVSSGTIDANTGGTPLTQASMITEAGAGELVERMYRTASVNGLSDSSDGYLYVGYDVYSWIYQGLVNGGSTNGIQLNSGANGEADADASNGLTFPGYGMKIIPVNGLTSQSKAYFARSSNLFIGVDLENDFENFEVWYSQDDRKVKLNVNFKVGTQVAFPGEVVAIEPAA